MNSFGISTILFSVILVAQARTPNRYLDSRKVPFDYVCKESGVFAHPTQCTRYILCNLQLEPFEQVCPACTEPERCPDDKLHFNEETKKCTFASEAFCPPRPTTTTTEPTTTKPGKVECKPNCTETGFCACYDICVDDPASSLGGYFEKRYCDEGLYWNPGAVTSAAHGGSCDFWENLSPELQALYRREDQEKCPTPPLPCEWKEDPDCDNKYFYRPDGLLTGNNDGFQHLECPSSPPGTPTLWWDQAAKTCGFKCNRSPGPCVNCK